MVRVLSDLGVGILLLGFRCGELQLGRTPKSTTRLLGSLLFWCLDFRCVAFGCVCFWCVALLTPLLLCGASRGASGGGSGQFVFWRTPGTRAIVRVHLEGNTR